MSGVEVTRFDGSPGEWDAFVRAQAGWTHFHLHGWRDVVSRVLRHPCPYLAARDAAGTMVGVLPLVEVRSLLFGHYLVSMPFVNYGGPLGSDVAIRALVDEGVRMAEARGIGLVELRSRVPLPLDLAVSHRKSTVLLPLPDDASQLFRQLPAKLRSQIRRPMKDGVEIRFGPGQVDAFHAVFARHMRDLGTPAQPRELFSAIAAAFPYDVRIAVAYLGEEPIASAWGFAWEREFEATWASALRAHKQRAANMLVYWALMEQAISDGVRLFNFGRCTPGSGTHRFKRQWGGRDEPLWWYQRTPSGAPAATPAPDHGVYALASRVWQRLPVPVTSALGPPIVRLIP